MVKKFSKNKQNKDKFLDIFLLTQEIFFDVLGKETPVLTKKEELKIEATREAWKKLIDQGWLILLYFGNSSLKGIMFLKSKI